MTSLNWILGAAGALLALVVLPATSLAKGWGVGVGYHNPVGADLGVSFLYAGQSFAFETAIGALDLQGDDDGESGAGLALAGDVDLKILFGSQIRPYVEVGVGFGLGAGSDGGGVSVGQGGGFAGGGVFMPGNSVYGLVGGDYIFASKRAQIMATIGLWL
jgi:hypothetical protein